MQNIKRLTIAELKAKAETANMVENMEAIQGAGLFNCHGKWGARGKAIGRWLDEKIDKIIEEVF